MKTFTEWKNLYEQNKMSGYVLRQRFDNLFESISDEFGVEHIAELSDSQFAQFIQLLEQYWMNQKYVNESVFDKDVRPLFEVDIKDDKAFREYAEKVLKRAHGNKYDQSIADETIDGILDKYGDDYGAAIGALQSGLGD